MRTFILCLLGAQLVLGCAAPAPPVVPMHEQFDAADHDPFLAPGTASINGQAFLRQRGGGTVTCAGSKVMLLPDTPFFSEIVDKIKTRRTPAPLAKLDPKYKGLLRQSQCDAQGSFVFERLPAGGWIIMTEVSWTVGYRHEGGALIKTASTTDGAPSRVMLSNDDLW